MGRRRCGHTLLWGGGVSLHPLLVLKHTLAFPDCSVRGGIISAWLYIAEEGRLFIIRGVGNQAIVLLHRGKIHKKSHRIILI